MFYLNIAIVCEGFDRSSLLLQPWHRVYEISKRMAEKKGLSVFVISNKTADSREREEIDGIAITRIDRLTLVGIFGKRELAKAVKRNNPDVVVWYGTPLSAIYLNQLRMIGKPVIWDIDMDIPVLRTLSRLSFRELLHPDHNLFLPQLLTILYPKFIMKRIANSRLISRIVVPSQCLKSSMCKIGVHPSRIRVIPSAIERGDSDNLGDGEKKLSRSELGFKESEFIVTYFGSPCTLRGTDIAILSMQKVLASKKNVKLMILSRRKTEAGSAENSHLRSEEDYLRKLVRRKGIESNVRIVTGILSKAQLTSYLHISDAIVLPFKIVFSEPPLSVLEAMNLGKVVVTTNLGTLSEIVGGDRGILIEPNNAQALAQAILFLVDHPKRTAQIGKNAQRFVAGLISWDQVAVHFEGLLRRTVTNKDDQN